MISFPFGHRSSVVVELVNIATSEKLEEVDWSINIEICELITNDQSQMKDVIKSIQKRLRSKSDKAQFYSVRLLELLLNNCGHHIYKLVIEYGILPILVKIVKKKNDLPIRQRIFFLLDSVQTVVGGSSGKFPQYHAAYHDLVSSGVKFQQRFNQVPADLPFANIRSDDAPIQKNVSTDGNGTVKHPVPQSGIIAETSGLLEVFRDVLDDQQNPEVLQGTSSGLIHDLVEQCSSQKEKVVHLVVNSSDESVVLKAIELIDQMDKLLAKHNALLSPQSTSVTTPTNLEEADAEEEDRDHELNRMYKGKECAIDDNPDRNQEKPKQVIWTGSNGAPAVTIPTWSPSYTINGSGPWSLPARSFTSPIPPPPTMHREREKFFRERKKFLKERQVDDGSSVSGRMGELSLHSLKSSTTSQSGESGITDFSDRDP